MPLMQVNLMRMYRSLFVGLLALLAVAGCSSSPYRPTPAPVEQAGKAPPVEVRAASGQVPAAGPAMVPARIGVLLPLKGPLADAARAIRDGMMAAYYRVPVYERPLITFYDSGSGQDIWSRYQQAVAEGATIVVGPLAKGEVAQLARAGNLPVPVLALNQVEGHPPGNLYQFALAPEDEAAQVAERARDDGFTSATVLTPQGEWGDRIFDAFRQRWEQGGGFITAHRAYDPSQHDFTPVLQGMVDGGSGGFLFLVAKPQQGREIRSQVPHAEVGGAPIYATSHIFTGVMDAQRDRDLEGVRFPDLPWLLAGTGGALSQAQVSTMLPDSRGPLGRLYAMGIDSFGLLSQLGHLQGNAGAVFEGQTGRLSLDAMNQVRRRLVWAEMRGGLPQAQPDMQPAPMAPVAVPTQGVRP